MSSREPRVVLVTGSSQGIGACVARELAAGGDLVHVVSRQSARVLELEEAFHGRAHGADLKEPAGCQALVRRVLELDGRLDHVVHAVGDFRRGSLSDTGWSDFEALLESNLGTSVHLAREVLPHLRKSCGSLTLFGVVGLEGHRARSQTAAYAAAKSALLVFARSLAREEAAHGVRVNMLSPGAVPHPEADPGTRAGLDREGPLGPTDPLEFARAVRWLHSDDAARVTGQNIEIAGGWML